MLDWLSWDTNSVYTCNRIPTIKPKENYNAKKSLSKKNLKVSIFKKLAPPGDKTVPNIVKETNMLVNTLYTWKSKISKNNPTSNKKLSKWSSSDKFQAVLKTASLSEVEIAKYHRKKRSHIEALKSWIKQCQTTHANKL